MKLIRQEKAIYYEYIGEGSITSLEQNAPLARMLKTLSEGGLQSFLEDGQLKKFAQGLLASFNEDGYADGGKVTAEGARVIKTQKAWKKLTGVFKLGVLQTPQGCYVISVDPEFDMNFKTAQTQRVNLNLKGQYENNCGTCVKDIQLKPVLSLLKKEQNTIDCRYDFGTGKSSYVFELNEKKITFPENEKTFKLIDRSIAEELLGEVLENYGKLNADGSDVWIDDFTERNALLQGAVDTVFEKGAFNAQSADGQVKVRDIRLNVKKPATAKKLLIKYLLKHAEERYLGYNEVFFLMSQFRNLFDSCADIPDYYVSNVYGDLIEEARSGNTTAFLRLCAYRDLLPETVQLQYRIGSVKQLSNRNMSMEDIVEEIIGKKTAVASVTVLTKFSNNPEILRGFCLFAKALKKRGALLNLITSSGNMSAQTNEVKAKQAEKCFTELKKIARVFDRKSDDIKKCHDRIYRVEKVSGELEWWTMTGELDSLRYNIDFDSVDEITVGQVKEMTFALIEEKGVPEHTRKIIEEAGK